MSRAVKSPRAFRTISEASQELGLPSHVLRFWESRFPQIKPLKRNGGRRYYRPEDLSLLRGIQHLLYQEGYTIKGVQKILRERGVRNVIQLGMAGEPDKCIDFISPDDGQVDLSPGFQNPIGDVRSVGDVQNVPVAPAVVPHRPSTSPDPPRPTPVSVVSVASPASVASPISPAPSGAEGSHPPVAADGLAQMSGTSPMQREHLETALADLSSALTLLERVAEREEIPETGCEPDELEQSES